MTGKEIIDQLLREIQQSIDTFNESMPAAEKEVLARVEKLLIELDRTGGNLTNSTKNIRAIMRLKKDIESAILTDKYTDSVAEFTEAFTTIATLQDSYFAALNIDFSPLKSAAALKEGAINLTIESLTENGITKDITRGVIQILRSNIVGESSYTDMLGQLRGYLTEDGNGAIERYASQITTDALNQYSAQYNQLMTSDLGLKWHQYVGSLKEKSREFCIKLTHKRWVHDVELPDILEGKIDGYQVPINPKTGLWYGANSDVTVDTFYSLRGGWRCGHQYLGVIDILVPKNIREETYRKYGMENELMDLENE